MIDYFNNLFQLFRFERENEDKLENFLKAELSMQLANLWFNFRLKIIGLSVLIFISFISVFIHQWNLTNAGLFVILLFYKNISIDIKKNIYIYI